MWQCAMLKGVAVCGSVWQCVAVHCARAWCCCSVYTAAVREGVLKLIVGIQELEVEFFWVYFFGVFRACVRAFGYLCIYTCLSRVCWCVLVCVCACVWELQCVCCRVVSGFVVCCSVLQCVDARVAVCCSVSQ